VSLHAVSKPVSHRAETLGYLFGLIGVASFSLTLPATRVAVQSIDPMLVASGRAMLAAVLGALCLVVARAARPRGVQWGSVAVVALCLGCLFPYLASIGSAYAPSSHGAVILGLLPIFTSLAGMLRVGERPSRGFWLAGALGSAAVISFALWQNRGQGLQIADLALFAAAIVASFGYAESARVAPALGSWQVVCWALLLALPVTISITLVRWSIFPPSHIPTAAWGAFAYVAAISQLFGVMLWTHGLKLGGVARVGQLQLLMPFMTFGAAAWWLGESVGPATWLAAAVVLASILFSRNTGVARQIPRPHERPMAVSLPAGVGSD
jgi:drug/metabolite transporter (DMT)-like permease